MSQRRSVRDEYDIPYLRNLLTAALNDEALNTFCYDHFREVYRDFTAGLTFRQKLNLIIKYCESNDLFDQLFALGEGYIPDAPQHPLGESLSRKRIEEEAETPPSPPEAVPSQKQFMAKLLDRLSGKLKIEAALGILFAVVFIAVILILVVAFPNPTPIQEFVFRVVLALSAAATVGAIIPGFINIDISFSQKFALSAGGAVAVFVIIYFLNPAQLTAFTPPPVPTATPAPTPTATPLAFATAVPDEILILVATFHRTEGVVETDARNEIRRAIEAVAAELDLTNLRVGVEPTTLTADERGKAKALGEQYGASMIIWGADTGVRITVNFLNLRESDFAAAEAKISETERTQLANPSAYASFITTDLPGQLTFLSFFAVGQSYLFAEDYPAAISTIERAIASLVPDTTPEGLVEAYFQLGWLYQGPMADAEQAIFNYSQAIALDSDHVDAYYNRGNAYFDVDNFEQAIRDYTQVIDRQSTYTAAFFNRGLAYSYSQNWVKAIEDYSKAIEHYDQAAELNPHHAEARYNRGLAYLYSGDFQRAISDFDTAIELNPNYVEAYLERGAVLAGSGNLKKAFLDFDKAVELNPNDAQAYYYRGMAYNIFGDPKKALLDFDKAIELNPIYLEAYLERGYTHLEAQNLPKAIFNFSKVIELNSTYAEAYVYRGYAYTESGTLEQAIRDYTQAIALKPNYAKAYYYRGLAYKDSGEPKKAIQDFKRYLELAPDTPEREEVISMIEHLQSMTKS